MTSSSTMALATLRQKRRAAEALYAADCPAEALRATAEALHAAAVIPGAASEALESLRAAFADAPHLANDAAVGEQDVRRLQAGLKLCRDAESVCLDAQRTAPQRVRRRVAQVALALGFALLLGSQAWLASLELDRWPSATGSGAFFNMDAKFGAHNITDGRPETEWVLTDRELGWAELKLFRRREVLSVSLLNGHNPPFHDRAVHDYRVELYRGDVLLAQAKGSFAALEAAPAPVTVDVHAQDVERVRVVVESYFGAGPALAEVEVR